MHLRVILCLLLAFSASTLCQKRKPKATCEECYLTMQELINVVNTGTREQIIEKYLDICVNYYGQRQSPCEGLAERNVDIVIYVIKSRFGSDHPVSAEAICYFDNHPKCPLLEPHYDWTLDLDFLGPKPAPIQPESPPGNSPTLKVLQITDLHLDPTYTPGNEALCGLYSCCRADQGPAHNASTAAGYWGDYRGCDMPVHAFQNLLDQVVENHPDIDYVMFTGDVIDHANWERTQESNTADFVLAMEMLKVSFPTKQVLPIFGNHESLPANRVAAPEWLVPENLTNNWLFELAAGIWGQWLPGTESTILKGGFYSVEVRPGLKIVALNNNFCYTNNWWLMYDSFDPSGQLMWLANELLAAEEQGQKVHILAHIPPASSSAWSICSREYRRIIDRFQNTVVAQFHGHTHRDHFNIYYDLDEPTRATSLSFIGGSATSYRNYNSNYRIYTIDGAYPGASFRVLDHSTWYFNLTEANEAGPDVKPNWQMLYSFKEAFNVTSLLPAEMDRLVHQMASDVTLQEKYRRFYVTAGDPSLEAGCDTACLQTTVCDIVKTVATDSCSQLDFSTAAPANLLGFSLYVLFAALCKLIV